MIDKTEIMDFAKEFDLATQVIEKDYVLGWVLAGIFSHPVIGSRWVFKGGTCLKKCFFETYRFSEDLDFTLPESKQIDQEFLVSCFRDISQWVYDATGIEVPQDLIRFNVYQNHGGGMSAQGQFWQTLPEVMEWMYGLISKTVKSAIPVGRQAIDATWRPPAMVQAWHSTAPLERIRFAAANRLCVNLHYQNKYRLIEPYSLRRTQEGNILLYALRHETDEWRAYRVERIQGAEITQTPFVPKYAVELTSVGPLSVPGLTRRSGKYDIFSPVIHRSSSKKQNLGPKYVIECPYCGRKFKHMKNNTRLNPHKDKGGYPCSGRTGYLVDTKY